MRERSETPISYIRQARRVTDSPTQLREIASLSNHMCTAPPLDTGCLTPDEGILLGVIIKLSCWLKTTMQWIAEFASRFFSQLRVDTCRAAYVLASMNLRPWGHGVLICRLYTTRILQGGSARRDE